MGSCVCKVEVWGPTGKQSYKRVCVRACACTCTHTRGPGTPAGAPRKCRRACTASPLCALPRAALGAPVSRPTKEAKGRKNGGRAGADGRGKRASAGAGPPLPLGLAHRLATRELSRRPGMREQRRLPPPAVSAVQHRRLPGQCPAAADLGPSEAHTVSVQEAALACARVLGAAGALGPLPAPGAAHCAGRWRAQGPPA